MKRRLPIMMCLALVACTTPSQRIAAKLTDLGVPQRQAACMGDRLGTRLSLAQLRRLDAIARTNGARFDRMRIDEIARALSDSRDPAIVAEFVRAGVGCLF